MTQAVQVTGAVCEHGEGPVWSAAWPGLRWVDMLAGDVLALAPDGGVTRRHLGTVLAALPVSQVTACTFGGPRLDQLYITTSRLGLPPSAEAAAGALFRADVGVTGLPAATFAG